MTLIGIAGVGGRFRGFLGRRRGLDALLTRLTYAFGRSALLGTLGAEVPDLTARGAKKRGGETSRPGTQVAIVSPDRLDEELPFPAALIDLITDTVRDVKRNLANGSTFPRSP